MSNDRHLPGYEPAIVRDAVFSIQRSLFGNAELHVRPGDRVEPSTELATAVMAEGRALQLNIAREFDMEPGTISRYLTKPVGSQFEEGESVARARRGLRSVSCKAPMASTLTDLDEETGIATLTPISHPQRLVAGIHGEVDSIIDNRGVWLRAAGSRVNGVMGMGQDTFGPLKIAVDRADREFTADMVDPDFQDSIVLAGMTLGTSALRRLIEVGVRGVIVGSVSDSEIRRYMTTGDQEPSSVMIWRQTSTNLQHGYPLSVFVTEGFGRRRMAQPVFQYLAGLENQLVSILIPENVDVMQARPSLYVTRERPSGDEAIQRVSVRDGTLARLIDPEHLGVVVTCRSGLIESPYSTGVLRQVVDVEFGNGTRHLVPATSLEVLIP
jgi:hypothetical protein